MRTGSRRAASAALLLALIAVPAVAHPGHDHKLMGTIAAIDGRTIRMMTTDKKDVSFEVNDKTKFVRSKKPGAFEDLKAGMRIVANVGDGKPPLKAKTVEYAAPPTSPAPAP
jgi:hypothetical protein